MGNVITFNYRDYPTVVTNGTSPCGGIPKVAEIFDPEGIATTTYEPQHYFLPGVLMDCKTEDGTQVQFNLYSDSFIVADNTRIVSQYTGAHRDVFITVDYGIEPLMGYYETPISDEGGIDINLIALYPGYYIGGWFATIEVTNFNDSYISVDYQANPDRFNFGEMTIGYHGFTVESFRLERRKTYISYRTWMPTIEPGGEPEELNVWVPTPTWQKGSEIKWGLYPSVTGVLKVWFMRFLIGMDAYF